MVDTEIIQRTNNLVHGFLPLSTVHGVDGILQTDACQHRYAGLPTQTVMRLNHNLHTVNLTDRVCCTIGTCFRSRLHHAERNPVFLSDLKCLQNTLLYGDTVIAVALRLQIAYEYRVLNSDLDGNVTFFFADLPYVERDSDQSTLIGFLNGCFKRIFHILLLPVQTMQFAGTLHTGKILLS